MYVRRFNEEILSGQLKDFVGRSSLVSRIESKKEFNNIVPPCRGLIYNNQLYMLNNPSTALIHDNLISHLLKIGILKKQDFNNSIERINFLDIFLRVIKIGNYLYFGDYGSNIDDESNKDFILNHLETLKKLKITFKGSKRYI